MISNHFSRVKSGPYTLAAAKIGDGKSSVLRFNLLLKVFIKALAAKVIFFLLFLVDKF